MRQLIADVAVTLERGIPLRGVCLYPVIGMPAWHEPETWLRMGLWDVVDGDRVLHEPMLKELSRLLGSGRDIVEGGFNGRRSSADRGV